jgi:hypothetical protein
LEPNRDVVSVLQKGVLISYEAGVEERYPFRVGNPLLARYQGEIALPTLFYIRGARLIP